MRVSTVATILSATAVAILAFPAEASEADIAGPRQRSLRGIDRHLKDKGDSNRVFNAGVEPKGAQPKGAQPNGAQPATDGARGHYDENGNWVGYPMTGPVPVPVPVPVPAAPVAAPIPAPAATDGARGHYDSSGRWVGYPMTGPSYPNPNWWGAYGAGPPTDRPTRIPTLAPTASDTGRPTRPPSPTIPPTPRPPEVAQGGLSLRGGPIDGGEGAFLGSSVSMSADGTIVATSSPGSFNQTGTVRVLRYEAQSGEWTQLGQDIVGSAEGDYLGDSARAVVLSRSGDYLAVASPSNSDDRGFVWIFAYNPLADRWTRVGRDIEGSVAGEASGHALALSSNGMVVAVGAPYAESMGMFLSGSVRIYSLQATPEAVGLDWVLAGQVGGTNGRDEAGYSLALSADGSRIAIGAPEAGSSAGELRVLQLTDPVPTALPANATQAEIAQAQLQTATQIGDNIFGTQFEDYLGISVSMSADGLRLAAGADMFGTSRNGEVRVLEWNAVDGTWDQMGQTLIGDEANDSFGWLVALNAAGNVLAASAINDEDSEYTKVYRYDLNTSRWVLLVKYEGASRGEAGYAQSGYSIDVNDAGTLLTVGAPESSVNGDRSGQVRVFELS